MEVELVVGTRRRRHVEGVLVGDVLRVAYPPRMSRAEAERIAQELRARMERRVASDRLDLARKDERVVEVKQDDRAAHALPD